MQPAPPPCGIWIRSWLVGSSLNPPPTVLSSWENRGTLSSSPPTSVINKFSSFYLLKINLSNPFSLLQSFGFEPCLEPYLFIFCCCSFFFFFFEAVYLGWEPNLPWPSYLFIPLVFSATTPPSNLHLGPQVQEAYSDDWGFALAVSSAQKIFLTSHCQFLN